MTACQRVSRFPVPGVLLGAGLDDHGPRKQNSGFVPREQQYGAGPDFEVVHERDRGAFAVRTRPPDLKGIITCTTRLSS
jgi:hypothetical protein